MHYSFTPSHFSIPRLEPILPYHEFLGIQYHANVQVPDCIQNIMDCGQRICMNIVDSKKVTTETLLDPSGNVIVV